MRRFTLTMALACVLAGVVSARSAPRDDCDGVMAQLVAAQREAQDLIDVIDTLESAIAAPTWDPIGDGWMVDAREAALADLVGALNAAAVAGDAAHEAHCY